MMGTHHTPSYLATWWVRRVMAMCNTRFPTWNGTYDDDDDDDDDD